MTTNEVKQGFSTRAGQLVAKGVKLPKSYDQNMHVLKLEIVFMGANDPLSNAKYNKACDNLEKILSSLESEESIPVILQGDTPKSDEALIRYAKRFSRIQFEMTQLQNDYDRRMMNYREKLARVNTLVANDRDQFVAILGRISSAEIEAEQEIEA